MYAYYLADMSKKITAAISSSPSSSFNPLTKLSDFPSLLSKTRAMTSSREDSPQEDYFDTKEKALSYIYDAYTVLPSVYHSVFVDPLKNLFTNNYDQIVASIDQTGRDIPWREWLDSINQRKTGYRRQDTHAFEESIADLYDGFLSMEERKRIKPPDYQTVSPLVLWGGPEAGPYTIPADPEFVVKLGINMSVVSMPPSYSENIVLWSAIGHETGGHDILHADKGLLSEIENVVEREILKNRNESSLRGQEVTFNGRKVPLVEFAASYWKSTMDETASDVCGLLNLGPAAGIGIATLLIPIRGGRLLSQGWYDDVHPIDALRVLLAADVIRKIPDLDVNVANAWGDALERIVDKYISDKNEFTLITDIEGNGENVIIPYDAMRETIKIVAKTIGFTPLDTLEKHSLSEINTWANSDESLTLSLADDILNNKEPSLKRGADEQTVYAAHIISAATIAMAESADIPKVTDLAVSALNKMYDTNLVWRGFPLRYRSNLYAHNMVPHFRTKYRSMVRQSNDSNNNKRKKKHKTIKGKIIK